MCCRGVHSLANPAFLGCFLFSGLPCVAPYFVPGGVRVVSEVATTCPTGGQELAESSAVALSCSTKFKGEYCKDCTTLSSMQHEVTSVRHKTLRLCNLLVRDLLPCRRRDRQYGTAQPIEDDRKVAPSRGAGWLPVRQTPDVNLGGLTCTKVHAENRTFVWRAGFLAV